MKERAKAEIEKTTAAFELEKVLLCPFGETSSFYYSRRLKNHNFTVTTLDSMEIFCYLWHEGEGEKASCTTLFKCIEAKGIDGL